MYQYGDLENWPAISAVAKDPDNYVSGRTVDHYSLYKDDIARAKSNMNATI